MKSPSMQGIIITIVLSQTIQVLAKPIQPVLTPAEQAPVGPEFVAGKGGPMLVAGKGGPTTMYRSGVLPGAAASQAIPQQQLQQPIPQSMPQVLPPAMPQALPQALPRAMPQAMPQALPQATAAGQLEVALPGAVPSLAGASGAVAGPNGAELVAGPDGPVDEAVPAPPPVATLSTNPLASFPTKAPSVEGSLPPIDAWKLVKDKQLLKADAKRELKLQHEVNKENYGLRRLKKYFKKVGRAHGYAPLDPDKGKIRRLDSEMYNDNKEMHSVLHEDHHLATDEKREDKKLGIMEKSVDELTKAVLNTNAGVLTNSNVPAYNPAV